VFFSPIRTALFGLLVWIVIWLLMPVYQVGRLELGALVYIALCYLFMFAGAAFVGRREPTELRSVETLWNRPLHRGLFWGTVALGLIGMALRLVDRLLIRGVEYGADALELREALSTSSSSVAGIVAAVLMPLCLVPLILLLASERPRSRILLAIAAVVFVLPMSESFFQLSRSFMLLTIGIAFATVSLTQLGGRLLNRKLIVVSLLGALALAVVSTLIFSARIEAGYRQLSDSVFDSAYAEFLQPNEFAWETIASGSELESFAMLSVLPNGLYYLTGAYEFSALWDRPDDQQFAYGQLLFYPFVRVAYRLVGVDFLNSFDIETYVYRDGVYQTFFGPLWADFGWFGLFVMAAFGALVQNLSQRVRRGSLAVMPLYIYMIIVVYFMPVVNFLTNGFGMLSVTAFTLFAIYAARIERAARESEEVRVEALA
jgi:hypothetical protein